MSDEDRPTWDEAFADRLVGATVLVGLTFLEAAGERHEQFFGDVESAQSGAGIVIRLRGTRSGEFYTLPPDLGAFGEAARGVYTLRATGEAVSDPDYLVTYRIAPRADG